MQHRPNCGLHWFEPFGTTAFENICDRPPVGYFDAEQRIFFWDQEPIHRDRFAQVFDQFIDKFRKPTHDTGVKMTLVTSELNSEEVAWACNTYNLTPAYYFFHGWAALDWYRGYDHSFLIAPYEQRKITRTFLMPNRIIAGRRQHRLIMLYHIFKAGMTNNHISCPAICPGENVLIDHAVQALSNRYPDIEQVFAAQQFPLNFEGETDSPMHSHTLSLFRESAESLLYLVTETVADGCRLHLTEKTFKPICLKMPFMIVGTQGSLAYLRSYGFRTFGDIWDESYDDEVNDLQRYEKIAWTLRALDSAPLHEKQRLFEACQEICEYNFNHFYSGGFEQVLWQELTGMIDEL